MVDLRGVGEVGGSRRHFWSLSRQVLKRKWKAEAPQKRLPTWHLRNVGHVEQLGYYQRAQVRTSARRMPTESFRPYNSMLEALEAPVSFSISWSDSVMSGWNGILCVILCTYEKYKYLHGRTRLAGKFLVSWTLSRQHLPFAPFLPCKRTESVQVWSISISKE